MRHLPGIFILLLFSSLACGQTSESAKRPDREKTKITTYETPGNLKSTRNIGCTDAAKLSNKDTPADLYKGIARCLGDGNSDRAVLLFALAGVYGRFDTLRVADTSAHQAVQVLQLELFNEMGETKKKEFGNAVQQHFTDQHELEGICRAVRKIGPPVYRPDYMINHGIGVYKDQKNTGPLLTDFDRKTAWETSLRTYLHCATSK